MRTSSKASFSRTIDFEFSKHDIADLSPDAEATDFFRFCLPNGGFPEAKYVTVSQPTLAWFLLRPEAGFGS